MLFTILTYCMTLIYRILCEDDLPGLASGGFAGSGSAEQGEKEQKVDGFPNMLYNYSQRWAQALFPFRAINIHTFQDDHSLFSL